MQLQFSDGCLYFLSVLRCQMRDLRSCFCVCCDLVEGKGRGPEKMGKQKFSFSGDSMSFLKHNWYELKSSYSLINVVAAVQLMLKCCTENLQALCSDKTFSEIIFSLNITSIAYSFYQEIQVKH